MRNTVLNYGNSKGIGVDVASLDILRGRDHGIAPYHVYLDKISTGKKNGIQEWSDYNGPLSYYVRKIFFWILINFLLYSSFVRRVFKDYKKFTNIHMTLICLLVYYWKKK